MSKEIGIGKFLNCEHDWKELGGRRVRDIKMLQCSICGKRKTVNTRIIKTK